MFHFFSSLWCFFYYVTTTLSMLLLQQHILNGIKITLFLGRSSYASEVNYNYVVNYSEIFCIMWQLHFSRFLKHVFLITLEIQLLCVFGPHFWMTILWYAYITYWNNVTATFRFCLLLRRNFITSKSRYIFVRCTFVFLKR